MLKQTKRMSLSERGAWDEVHGRGRKPTWKDYGGIPKWLVYPQSKIDEKIEKYY